MVGLSLGGCFRNSGRTYHKKSWNKNATNILHDWGHDIRMTLLHLITIYYWLSLHSNNKNDRNGDFWFETFSQTDQIPNIFITIIFAS